MNVSFRTRNEKAFLYLLENPTITKEFNVAHQDTRERSIDDKRMKKLRKKALAEEGWFFPDDFANKKRFYDGEPLWDSTHVPRDRTSLMNALRGMIEERTINGKVKAIRLKRDEQTLIKIWKYMISTQRHQSFMTTNYWKTNPFSKELMINFATAMGAQIPDYAPEVWVKIYPSIFMDYLNDPKKFSNIVGQLVENSCFDSPTEVTDFMFATNAFIEYVNSGMDENLKGRFHRAYFQFKLSIETHTMMNLYERMSKKDIEKVSKIWRESVENKKKKKERLLNSLDEMKKRRLLIKAKIVGTHT